MHEVPRTIPRSAVRAALEGTGSEDDIVLQSRCGYDLSRACNRLLLTPCPSRHDSGTRPLRTESETASVPPAAPRIDPRLAAAIARLDDGKRPYADTNRAVGTAAERLGLCQLCTRLLVQGSPFGSSICQTSPHNEPAPSIGRPLESAATG